MDSAPPTVRELAQEFGISQKTLRAWMRRANWRSLVEHGQQWVLSPEQAALLRDHFGAGDAEANALNSLSGDPLQSLSVAELLATYRRVLASLRARGLVRTNNAPIGDLAEYCAAIVYDGLLAPNSEKSYDLVAEDGRRVQVKVRLIRPDTRESAAFSPLRSFDFDAAVFLLINDDDDKVELAKELSASEVLEHGRYRDHSNGTVLKIGQLRRLQSGVDLTEKFNAAWLEMLAPNRPTG